MVDPILTSLALLSACDNIYAHAFLPPPRSLNHATELVAGHF